MRRAILAGVAGYVAWSVLWALTQKGLDRMYPEIKPAFQAGEKLTDVAPLLIMLVASVVCSIAAGKTAACLGRERARGAVLGAGIALLITGVGVQVFYWSQMPVWFHLSFLIPILPVVVIAGRKRREA